ncbi:MAG TPA: hypothetical protein V6C97_21375 [Oculatellaceae cyanobacterium]
MRRAVNGVVCMYVCVCVCVRVRMPLAAQVTGSVRRAHRRCCVAPGQQAAEVRRCH